MNDRWLISNTWMRALGLYVFGAMLVFTTAVPSIICVGSDGHVALEGVAGGRCSQSGQAMDPTAAAATQSGVNPTSICCGPCSDVLAFAEPYASGAHAQPGMSVALGVLALPTALTGTSVEAVSRLLQRRHPQPSFPPPLLTTSVFRC